jgi:hypothetical protein
MNDLTVLVALVLVVCIPLALIMWQHQKNQLGIIRCRRCHHEGLAKGLFIMGRGIKPVCAKCQSENWETLRD